MAMETIGETRSGRAQRVQESARGGHRLPERTREPRGVAMLVARPDGRLVHVNADACRLLGYSQEQLLTASVHEVLSWPTRQWSDAWRELRELGSVSFESTQRRTDGGVFPVELKHGLDGFGEEGVGWVGGGFQGDPAFAHAAN